MQESSVIPGASGKPGFTLSKPVNLEFGKSWPDLDTLVFSLSVVKPPKPEAAEVRIDLAAKVIASGSKQTMVSGNTLNVTLSE